MRSETALAHFLRWFRRLGDRNSERSEMLDGWAILLASGKATGRGVSVPACSCSIMPCVNMLMYQVDVDEGRLTRNTIMDQMVDYRKHSP